jgi:hypothetical protein
LRHVQARCSLDEAPPVGDRDKRTKKAWIEHAFTVIGGDAEAITIAERA